MIGRQGALVSSLALRLSIRGATGNFLACRRFCGPLVL